VQPLKQKAEMAFRFLNWQYVGSKLVAAQIPAVDFDHLQANKVEMSKQGGDVCGHLY
jgi:hypothetical protein